MFTLDDSLNKAINAMSSESITRIDKYNKIIEWWQSQPKNTRADYECLLDNFRILFSYNSSSIEGNKVDYHTTREVFDSGSVTGFSGSLRDLFEVQNQKFCYNILLDSLVSKRPLDEKFILKLHRVLLYGTYDETRWIKGERPGTYKVNDYCIGSTDEGSYPEDVHNDIQNLLDELNSEDGDILVKASYFHLEFEAIHPFADGNGRLGRVLLNYFLMLNNYPPIIIFNEDKTTYYLALEMWDRMDKLDGFKELIIDETIKTWKRKILNV